MSTELDHAAARSEELEALQSILTPEELESADEEHVKIRIQPEVDSYGSQDYVLYLEVRFTPSYPDELPDTTVEVVEGELEPDEMSKLQHTLNEEAEANLGMAMVYTLSMVLRDTLASLIAARSERKAAQVEAKEREVEQRRAEGTPITKETFAVWKAKWDAIRKAQREQEQEERLKQMTAKEREDLKRAAHRLTGKQVFEANRNIDEEAFEDE